MRSRSAQGVHPNGRRSRRIYGTIFKRPAQLTPRICARTCLRTRRSIDRRVGGTDGDGGVERMASQDEVPSTESIVGTTFMGRVSIGLKLAKDAIVPEIEGRRYRENTSHRRRRT